ncbi:MAG: hypothetical protein UW53_C0031G0004 [Candidatus Giovannonibacteria bacterium GW2011_GWA1_44_25]|uniref:Uncharacterized protein n=1 Tax=Candidatus Giovannonibacteria bacterium GW2011_GWA1_44_25 TaxID=1618645 RepID=A0A0G1LFK2_9BACT|nr:MAG: hypothetical protein UW53_C0031G0004 [Candidatus Giovannonibacteria bacterium GW2011_GWA1_44_25]
MKKIAKQVFILLTIAGWIFYGLSVRISISAFVLRVGSLISRGFVYISKINTTSAKRFFLSDM